MVASTLRRPVRKASGFEAFEDFDPDFSPDKEALIAQLTQAFLDAYQSAAPDVKIDTAMRERAAAFAKERAGDLIDDLTDATRDRIKELVAEAIANGDSPQQLARRLRDDDLFSKERAMTIARTEGAIALGQGQRSAAMDMNQDEKSWQGGDCEVCKGNEDDGWIGIDETFSSGDDTIPAHPRCTCTCIYRTSGVHEDAAPVEIRKDVRCPDCHRLLGRLVNVGALLWCQRCREEKPV